jgi:CheY-like chemotaxis protein
MSAMPEPNNNLNTHLNGDIKKDLNKDFEKDLLKESDKEPNSQLKSVPQAKVSTCLIVDDDRDLREIYRFAFEGLGYQVTEAEDGEIGLNILRKQTFTLLMLDLQMPNTDGKKVLQTVRQMFIHEKMKIVVNTSNAAMITDDISAIADLVMQKPVVIQQLTDYASKIKH